MSTLSLGTRTSTWCTSSTIQDLPDSSTIRYHAPRRRPSFSARSARLRAHPMSAMSYSSSSGIDSRSEEHTSELQSPCNLVCRLLLEKKKQECHMTTLYRH